MIKEYIVYADPDELFYSYNNFYYKEFIRCKDCKWYEFDVSHRCGYTGLNGYISEYDFCSKAEPKEDTEA
jgi:hypothetical protein